MLVDLYLAMEIRDDLCSGSMQPALLNSISESKLLFDYLQNFSLCPKELIKENPRNSYLPSFDERFRFRGSCTPSKQYKHQYSLKETKIATLRADISVLNFCF